MSNVPIYLSFIFSFLSTVGFSIFFNAPKHCLIYLGFTGAIGWTVYACLFSFSGNLIVSNFIAAATVSLISEILARKLKEPAILFVIPGILPLVPGLGMYNTMLYMIQKDFDLSIATGADTLFIGGAIALGILVITSLSRTINIAKFKKQAARK